MTRVPGDGAPPLECHAPRRPRVLARRLTRDRGRLDWRPVAGGEAGKGEPTAAAAAYFDPTNTTRPRDRDGGRPAHSRSDLTMQKKAHRVFQAICTLAAGSMLLQAGGCDLSAANELLQTVFLGISAAGAIAILQNI